MSNTKHTPGPWRHAGHDYAQGTHITVYCEQGTNVASVTKSPWTGNKGPSAAKYLEVAEANARLITAAPDQHEEMVRHLTILERLEADPELWARMTKGTGIATLNAYRAAIAKATAQ